MEEKQEEYVNAKNHVQRMTKDMQLDEVYKGYGIYSENGNNHIIVAPDPDLSVTVVGLDDSKMTGKRVSNDTALEDARKYVDDISAKEINKEIYIERLAKHDWLHDFAEGADYNLGKQEQKELKELYKGNEELRGLYVREYVKNRIVATDYTFFKSEGGPLDEFTNVYHKDGVYLIGKVGIDEEIDHLKIKEVLSDEVFMDLESALDGMENLNAYKDLERASNDRTADATLGNNYQYVRGNLTNVENKNGRLLMTVVVEDKGRKEYISTMAAGKKAESIEKLNYKKGDFVQIEGEASFTSYKDANGKINKSNTLFVNNIERFEIEKGKPLVGGWRQQPNVVELKGNLTVNSKKIENEKAKSITKLSVANNISYQKAGKTEWETKTNYVEAVAFNKIAAKTQELNKGDGVAFSGEMRNVSYKDKQGDNRYSANVVVKDISLTQKKVKEVEKETPAVTKNLVESNKKNKSKGIQL